MDVKDLQLGMTVKVKTSRGRREAEYIGRWADSFVFRMKGTDQCVVFTSREVAEEIFNG